MSLPFTVIGGFLGAGKTTLLNHWLRHAAGQRIAVLVNDFGALNIDAGLIESSHGDTIALTNGCVCCQIGDDLSMALMRVLDTADAFDAVVVEASGVSDPWRIAQMGRADPGLRLDGVIVVVDASAALMHARDALLADTLTRQLIAADLIVLNKADLVTEAQRAQVRAWITAVAGAAPQVEAIQAAVPLALLGSVALPSVHDAERGADGHGQGRGHGHGHGHEHRHNDQHAHADEHDHPDHGSVFDTWSCRPPHAFDAEALRGWLRAPPSGLLRLKGVLRTGAQAWSELQFAGRHGTLRPCAAPADGAAVVAIALRSQLPTANLVAFFRPPSE